MRTCFMSYNTIVGMRTSERACGFAKFGSGVFDFDFNLMDWLIWLIDFVARPGQARPGKTRGEDDVVEMKNSTDAD